ncbi:MAG TPA: hypothetical protein VGG86_04055 [Roseiarcus sp.]
MRFLSPAVGALLAGLTVSAASAAVPNSIASLLWPSIGYLMGQSDLCEWNLNDRIRATYQKDFAQIGMTDEQQSAAWLEAQARESKLTSLPPNAQAGMKSPICSSAARAELEKQLAD